MNNEIDYSDVYDNDLYYSSIDENHAYDSDVYDDDTYASTSTRELDPLPADPTPLDDCGKRKGQTHASTIAYKPWADCRNYSVLVLPTSVSTAFEHTTMLSTLPSPHIQPVI